MRLMRLSLALLSFCCAVPAQADTACTEIGCIDGLSLTVPPDYHWGTGDYVFSFTLDGRAVTCTGALPLKECGEASMSCDGDDVMITESGCALLPEAHGFGNVYIASSPTKIQVKVTRNGAVLMDKKMTPRYRDTHPNGAQCEPQCRQATVALFETAQ
jgi:hypothetical protein